METKIFPSEKLVTSIHSKKTFYFLLFLGISPKMRTFWQNYPTTYRRQTQENYLSYPVDNMRNIASSLVHLAALGGGRATYQETSRNLSVLSPIQITSSWYAINEASCMQNIFQRKQYLKNYHHQQKRYLNVG